MTRRRPTPDEMALWKSAVRHAERLHPRKAEAGPPQPAPKPKPAKTPLPRIEPFQPGQLTPTRPARHVLAPPVTERLAQTPVRMDRKAHTRLKRGKLKPEARLDLHGMRLEAAHGALIRFILSSQAAGKRLVLVITGKGKDRDEPGPIPTPRGVLRNQVPHWLDLPPLAQAVLQIAPAHISHGGDGAYYVYLRRPR